MGEPSEADETGSTPAAGAAGAAGAAVRDPARLAAVRATGLLDADAEEVFDRLSRLAVRLLGVPAAFLSLVDAERDVYLSACGFGEPLASARQLTGPTFCHYALASPGPLVIPDTAADPVYRDVPTVRTLGVAAYVGVPVRVGGQRVGSFCAIDTRPRAWTAGEVEVLTELAASAEREIELRAQRGELVAASRHLQEQQVELEQHAEALQEANAKLSAALADAVRARRGAEADRGRLEAAHAALAQTERRSRFLADLGQALQPLADPDALMAATARLLGEHLGADGCAYAEVEADEDTFTITGDYTRGDTASIVGRFTLAAFGAEVLRLMRANAPYVADDVWADPRVTGADRAAYERTQIRAVVCVPLHKAGRLAAAMAVHQRGPRAWAPDEVDLVVTVVQRCWESLERARAYRDLAARGAALAVASAQLAERTAAAEQAQRVAEAERRAAEEARATAEAANAAKAHFLANMSHELRTPLNAIGGYVQLVELGVHGPVTDAQRGALARVQAAQRHLLGLITDILDYAKVEGGRVEYDVRPVDAREVVAAVGPLVEPLFRAKGLAYAARLPDAPVLVWADRERLAQVLVNLLANAAKFTDATPGGAPGPAGGAEAVVLDVATRRAGPDGPNGGRPDPGDGNGGRAHPGAGTRGAGTRAREPGARRGGVPPRARHRARDRPRPAGARVRAVRAARHAVRGRRAWHRLGPGDQPRPGARHGGGPARAQRQGRRVGVHRNAAPRAGRGRAANRPSGGRRPPRGRAPGRGRPPGTGGEPHTVRRGRGHSALPRSRARRGGARGQRPENATGGCGRRGAAAGRCRGGRARGGSTHGTGRGARGRGPRP
jgi:signal transduction histidine kinase